MAQQNYILENISDKSVLVKLDQITRFNSPIDKYLERAKIDGSTAKYAVTGFNPITKYDKDGVPDDEYRKLASAPYEEEEFELVHYKTHDVFGKEIFDLALDSKAQNELVATKLANMAISFSRRRYDDLQTLLSNFTFSDDKCPYRREQVLEWSSADFKKAEEEEIADKIEELITNCTEGINNTKDSNDAYCNEKDILLFVSRKMGVKARLALDNKFISDSLAIGSRVLAVIAAPKLTNGALAIACNRYTIKSDFCIDMIVKDPMRGDTLRQIFWKHVKEHTNLSAKSPLVCLREV